MAAHSSKLAAIILLLMATAACKTYPHGNNVVAAEESAPDTANAETLPDNGAAPSH